MGSPFLDGIGAVIGKVTTFIPGRIEGLKNKKEKLTNERKKLMSGPAAVVATKRVHDIDIELQKINTALGNKATD